MKKPAKAVKANPDNTKKEQATVETASATLEEPTAQTAEQTLNANEKKWGKKLLKAKFTVIPNIIFERQLALGLDAIDINIILHLAGYWWTKESKPRPAKATIAEAMKVTPRTVQRHIAKMEAKGYIKRERRFIRGQGSQPNAYHFDGLIEKALPLAEEKIKETQRKQRERDERNGRKKPLEAAF